MKLVLLDDRCRRSRQPVLDCDRHFGTRLSEQEKGDLIEFLKSIQEAP